MFYYSSHHEMTYFAPLVFALCTFHHIIASSVTVWRLLAPAPDWAPSIGAGSGPDCQAAVPPSTLGQQSQVTKLNWNWTVETLLSPSIVLTASSLHVLHIWCLRLRVSVNISSEWLRCPGEMLWLRLWRRADGDWRQGFWTRDTGIYSHVRWLEWCNTVTCIL